MIAEGLLRDYQHDYVPSLRRAGHAVKVLKKITSLRGGWRLFLPGLGGVALWSGL
jgi:hypothetical protein